MRVVFGLVLLLGIGLAGFAAYTAKDYIAQLEAKQSATAPAIPTKPVFVMNRTIRYGETLAPEDLRRVAFPVAALPEGAFLTEEAMFPEGTDVPRAVLRTMEKDEAVLASKVTAPGEDAGVSSRLSPGMRAFAIRVDVSSGVSGFLRPGDRVDIYWTGTLPDDRDGRREVTQLILAGVNLVAIDQSADADRTAPNVAQTVTVEASPRDVAALAQAQSTGSLSLSLVGAEDTTVSGVVEIDQKELLGIVEQQVAEVEEKEVCTITTRRGAEAVEIPIPCTN